ncbi:hypothetical protein BUALT_Bualt13G0096600 [Buddleja alternifolia]|uniref:Malonyl-CoA:ACP transacylase (MAT) domain-containing protein n=1 Tax=Buddleja alternifolia TaxID=168488 RepID=A0AAV6WUK0_9LAMI|nr:hypothetical protein BUALT_Bualt13G0096600 [Buddleja alternifolia]
MFPMWDIFCAMTTLWDQLVLTESVELQACAAYIKCRDEDRFVQLLMGLRPEFENCRSGLLHRKPLPSVEDVVNELMAKEICLKSLKGVHTASTSVLTTSSSAPGIGRLNVLSYVRRQVGSLHSQGKVGSLHKSRSHGRKPSQQHHGGQQKPYSGGQSQTFYPPTQAAFVPFIDHLASGTSVSPNIDSVADQFQKFLAFQQFQSNSQSYTLSARSDSSPSIGPGINSSSWILDSGVGNHMSPDFSAFISISSDPQSTSVVTADGTPMSLTGIGTIHTSTISLPDVYCIPKLHINLASAGQICDFSCFVGLFENSCYVQDLKSKRVIGTGRRKGKGLYVLDELHLPTHAAVMRVNLSSSHLTPSSSKFYLWHSRLGHVSGSRLRFMCTTVSGKLYVSRNGSFIEHVPFFSIKSTSHGMSKSDLVEIDPFTTDCTSDSTPISSVTSQSSGRSHDIDTQPPPTTVSEPLVIADPVPPRYPKRITRSTQIFLSGLVSQILVWLTLLLRFDLLDICINGPKEKLDSTVLSQPAIYVTSLAAVEVLRARDGGQQIIDSVDITCGLSLGEYTALAFAGAFSFEDGLKLVKLRGEAMQDAADAAKSAMVSIIGLDSTKVQQLCDAANEEVDEANKVQIANFLCTGNYAVSGGLKGIEAVEAKAKSFKARMTVRLAVAGAFHTSFMEPAVSRLESALALTEIRSPRIPVISNVDAEPHADPDTIKKILARQVTSPVQWETTVKTLLSKGLKKSYELGPGKVIAGIVKRMDKGAAIENIGA